MADYVDNTKFTKELGEWARRVRKAEKEGLDAERMPDYVANCVFLTCNNMAYKSSFINYSYRDDLVGDAIENCVKYLKNFDGDKSDNGFGYLSTIIYYAFVRRIKKENKRHKDHLQYIKKVYIEDNVEETIGSHTQEDIQGYEVYIDRMMSIFDDMNIEEDDIKEDDKPKAKSTFLDEFLTEEIDDGINTKD